MYYETEPVLTGGFSEVNRAERIRAAQAEFRAAFTEWPEADLNAYVARHYPAYWLKVDLQRKIRHARFLRASEQAGHKLAINVGFDEARAVTELTILAVDHPWLLSVIAGACASAGANIVDAQIYTTTDGRALDTISISREYDRDEDEGAAPPASARPSKRYSKASCGYPRRSPAARAAAARPSCAPSWSSPRSRSTTTGPTAIR